MVTKLDLIIDCLTSSIFLFVSFKVVKNSISEIIIANTMQKALVKPLEFFMVRTP